MTLSIMFTKYTSTSIHIFQQTVTPLIILYTQSTTELSSSSAPHSPNLI